MKLLIVEDSTLISSRLRVALASIQRLETVIANNFTEGLSCFRHLLPDLAILDIQLPGGTGIDLLRTIKGERPSTRVLMFSNHACYRGLCGRAGAEDFFDKAGDFEALTQHIEALAREEQL